MANGHQNVNNNAVSALSQQEHCRETDDESEDDDADDDDESDDDDGGGRSSDDELMDSQDNQAILESVSLPSDLSEAVDRSPRRKKKKKSLECLIQIRQEEVRSAYWSLVN